MAGKLHCPNCKSDNFTNATESNVTGAMSTTRGNIRTTHVSNEHRHYWVCKDCGTKFRNIQSLEEEIKKYSKTPIFVGILSAIAFILTVFFIVEIAQNPLSIIFFGFLTLACAVVAIVCLCMAFVYKNKIKKMKAEAEYLKENCFD